MKEVFGDKFSREARSRFSLVRIRDVVFVSRVKCRYRFNLSIRCKDSKSDCWIVSSICFFFFNVLMFSKVNSWRIALEIISREWKLRYEGNFEGSVTTVAKK